MLFIAAKSFPGTGKPVAAAGSLKLIEDVGLVLKIVSVMVVIMLSLT